MNIKQTIQRLEENGYTCKRSAWGALDASRHNERVTVYFARRGKNGRNAERVCFHLVGCFSQRNNGIRAREFSLAKRLSKTIFAGVEVWQNGCGSASFFNGVLKTIITVVNGLYIVNWLSLARAGFSDTYATTLYFAKQFGGRKFHNKSYGGGIAFDCLLGAQYALECATGKRLCAHCRNVLMDYEGELCPKCEESYEKLQSEKDLQRQTDREKYCIVK